MLNFFKKRRSSQKSRQLTLGYVLSVFNEPLGVDSVGSPKEILDETGNQGLDFAEVANHPETEVRASAAYKDGPELEIAGGPAALPVMELMEAVEKSDLTKISKILDSNRNLEASEDATVAVPLHFAIQTRNVPAIRLLASGRVGQDTPTELGMTPLHWAAASGELEAVEVLLDAGAQASCLNWFLLTPAEIAAINKQREIARMLGTRTGREAKKLSADEILERMGGKE